VVTAAPLSSLVSEFWYWRGVALPSATERLLPMGTVELVVDLSNERSSILSGPHSRSFTIERQYEHELVGIHFRPGGAFPFFGAALGELLNLNVSLADVCGRRAVGQLVSRVHGAPAPDEKLSVLEGWLSQLAARPIEHHAAVEYALGAFARRPIPTSASIAAEVSMSQRRFIQLFRAQVGLPPKLFCRIRRFQAVIHAMQELDVVDWSDLAQMGGYYDQSHFIHEFREFGGLSPSEYLRHRIREEIGHVRVA
jgi:AraC-like DNA-binding protein